MDSLYFFVKSLDVSQIHYLYHRFTINSLSFLQIHYESIIFFVDSLWFYYLFGEFSMNSIFFREFTTFFVHSLWIQLVCREYTMNTSRIYLFHEFTIDSLTFLRIHYLFHEYVINVFSVFTNKRELLRCHHILVRLYLFRAFAIFFDQIVCKVYYMLYSDKMSFSKFCCYYSYVKVAVTHMEWVINYESYTIVYRYFIFSKFILNPRKRFGRNF